MNARAAIVAVAALILAVLGAAIGVAAAKAATTWQTCDPGTKEYAGAYRIFDNAWAGPSSRRFCVSSTGLNISIDSRAIPAGGNVVAYPSIRFGAFYSDGDPQSGMPVRIREIGPMTLNVSSRGHAAGLWLTDADLWFRPRAKWDQHGTYEIVIANRWQGFGQPGGTSVNLPDAYYRGRPVVWHARPVIHHVAYRVTGWITRDPVTGYTWPILVFRQVHQSDSARLKVGAFVWWARHHARLPSGWWLGDVAYGSELWSGGRGLTDSMTVTWPGLPVITHHIRGKS